MSEDIPLPASAASIDSQQTNQSYHSINKYPINRFQATNCNNTKQLRSELPSPQKPIIYENEASKSYNNGASVFGSNPRAISVEEPEPESCSSILCNDTDQSKLPALRISVHHTMDSPHNPLEIETDCKIREETVNRENNKSNISASPPIAMDSSSIDAKTPCGINPVAFLSPTTSSPINTNESNYGSSSSSTGILSPASTIDPLHHYYHQLSPINIQQSLRNTSHQKTRSRETEDEVLREIEDIVNTHQYGHDITNYDMNMNMNMNMKGMMHLMGTFQVNTVQYGSSQNSSNNNNNTHSQNNNGSNGNNNNNNNNNGNNGNNCNNGYNQNYSGNGSGGNNGGRKGRDDSDDGDEEKKQNDKQMDDDDDDEDDEDDEDEEEKKNEDESLKHRKKTKVVRWSEFKLNSDAPSFCPQRSISINSTASTPTTMPTIDEKTAMFAPSKSAPMPSKQYKSKRNSSHNKNNHKQHHQSQNQYLYDPNPLHRAKGNIQISRHLTTDIIPNTIKESINNMYDYVDKSTAIVTYHRNHFNDGKIRIFNHDFHDEKSDEILYLVADHQDENITKHRNFKYRMREKLFTKYQLYDLWNVTENDVPSSRNKQGMLTNDIDAVNDIFSNAAALCQNVIFKTKWHRIPIFNTANNNKQNHKQYNKQRLTFSITKTEFIDAVQRFVHSDKNNKALIPIVMFNQNGYQIEYLQIVEIRDNIDIGISYIYHPTNGIKATGIHLNKNNIRCQHQLVAPSHDCHCLDGFKSDIDELHIGNPDDHRNRAKDFKKKHDILKTENKDLEYKVVGLENTVNIFKEKADELQSINNHQQHKIQQLHQIISQYKQANRGSVHSMITCNTSSPSYTAGNTPSYTSQTLPSITPQSVRSISSISEHSTTFSSASNAVSRMPLTPIMTSQPIGYNPYISPIPIHQLPPLPSAASYDDGTIHERNEEKQQPQSTSVGPTTFVNQTTEPAKTEKPKIAGSYEPNINDTKCLILISQEMTKTIIPLRIIETVKDIYTYIVKMVALQHNHVIINGDCLWILYFEFHDNKTGQPLYCIADKLDEKEKNNGGYNWRMHDVLYTAEQICNLTQLSVHKLPTTIINTAEYKQEMETIDVMEQILNDPNKREEVFNTNKAWQNVKIFKNEKEINKIQRKLGVRKPYFLERCKEFANNVNGIKLIPIICNKNEDGRYGVDGLWILRIDENTDIGISFKYDINKKFMMPSGIHLDGGYMEFHCKLADPQQSVLINQYFDNFISKINDISID